MPIESRWTFYWRLVWEWVSTYGGVGRCALSLYLVCKRIKFDPAAQHYMDVARTPIEDAVAAE